MICCPFRSDTQQILYRVRYQIRFRLWTWFLWTLLVVIPLLWQWCRCLFGRHLHRLVKRYMRTFFGLARIWIPDSVICVTTPLVAHQVSLHCPWLELSWLEPSRGGYVKVGDAAKPSQVRDVNSFILICEMIRYDLAREQGSHVRVSVKEIPSMPLLLAWVFLRSDMPAWPKCWCQRTASSLVSAIAENADGPELIFLAD